MEIKCRKSYHSCNYLCCTLCRDIKIHPHPSTVTQPPAEHHQSRDVSSIFVSMATTVISALEAEHRSKAIFSSDAHDMFRFSVLMQTQRIVLVVPAKPPSAPYSLDCKSWGSAWMSKFHRTEKSTSTEEERGWSRIGCRRKWPYYSTGQPQ